MTGEGGTYQLNYPRDRGRGSGRRHEVGMEQRNRQARKSRTSLEFGNRKPAHGQNVPAMPYAPGGAGSFAVVAANAMRASSGRDFTPVRFMIAARWFSTVR